MIIKLHRSDQPPAPNLPPPSQSVGIPNKFKGKNVWEILDMMVQEDQQPEIPWIPEWKMNFLDGLTKMLASPEMMIRLQKRFDCEQPQPERN